MGRGVGLSVRSGWMMGKGQNLRSGYILIYVEIGRISTKVYILHQIIIFCLP